MFATNSALRMSPFTNRTLESAISSLIVPRFPAYVSLSKTTTYISSSYFFNKYFSLDFAQQDGKLVLSKGQLTSCVLIGGAGYFGAAKDRGKQNFLETLFRYPLVGFYIITGSDLFEKGFKKLLLKAGKCKETISKDLKTPSFEEIEVLAKKIAERKKSSYKEEFKKLTKQKVLIFGVPFLFSIGVMGFFVAGISNLFTKFRFNQEQKLKNSFEKPESEVFKGFM